MTFLDIFVTGGGNNDSGYSNPDYDKLIAEAKVESDTAKRKELLREAEDILMEDMPILPIYYYTTVMGWNENVKGIQVSVLGTVYLQGAYIE